MKVTEYLPVLEYAKKAGVNKDTVYKRIKAGSVETKKAKKEVIITLVKDK